MKKQYDITRLTDELTHSVFFQKPEQPEEPKEKSQKFYQKPEPSLTPKSQEEKKPEGATSARTDVNVHARTHTRIDALPQAIIASLHHKLKSRHHLSSYTFRFRFEELEALAKLDTKIEKSHPQKMSKNDLVRLGVNWLLEDYEQNGEQSMLACILARM
jgi:hypothetical protein